MGRMRPFFPYYGAKWRIVDHYPRPLHRQIVEPFAGSAQYSTRWAGHDILLVDMDPVVCGVWRYLIGASVSDLLALPDPEPGQPLEDLPVCEEARWLIGFWVQPASARPACRPSGWYDRWRDPESANVWGRGVRERLASQVGQIRHWRVICAPYIEAGDGAATWFVDPPYQGDPGRHYRHGSGDLDYDALARWCCTRRGQVIVCEGVGADWLPFVEVTTGRNTRNEARQEMIWTRGMAPARQIGFDLEDAGR